LFPRVILALPQFMKFIFNAGAKEGIWGFEAIFMSDEIN
jgi:hypothetical protein